MSLDTHTISQIDGSNFSRQDRVLCGLLANVVNNSSSGVISSVTVNTAGAFATLPTIGTSGHGTGATLVANMKAVSALPVTAGTGYAPTNTITLTGGTESTNAILTVATTQLVSAAVNAGGSGYVVGDTITLAGGTATTPAVLTVASVSSGAVSTFTITTPGVYTTNNTSFTQASTSGVGTGATFNTGVFGVLSVTVTTAGSYTALPNNPVAQGSTSGSGTGATFAVTWGVGTVTVSAAGTGYDSGSRVTFTGGGQTVAPTTTINLGSQTGNTSTTQVTFGANANLPATYGVWVNPKQPVFWEVDESSKTATGFIVKMTPLSGNTVSAGTMDVLLIG